MKPFLFFLLAAAVICPASIPDFDADHNVNLNDYLLLCRAWHAQAGNPHYNDLCDIALPKNQVIDSNDLLVLAENWLWQAIRLDVYSDGWGHFCQTLWVDGEGDWTIRFSDANYRLGYDGRYYAYVSHPGDFTEVFAFLAQDVTKPIPPGQIKTFEATVQADLDPTEPNLFNGMVYLTQNFFAGNYLRNTSVNVLDPSTGQTVTSFVTDQQGRFSTELENGFYLFSFLEGGYEHLENASISGCYQDYRYPSFFIALKPNIYLYPEQTAEMTVTLEFPFGGNVIASEPDYAAGWQVKVDPSGRIDEVFDYLFYESVQPDRCQYEAGWVVNREDLEPFFRTNLAQTGFIQSEIDDFIEYWIPLLNGSPCYAVYPQYNDDLESMVRLDLSLLPDNMIRLFYCMRPIPNIALTLPAPQIPAFSRSGFTVAEWGVILK